jgi:hypothetical protein
VKAHANGLLNGFLRKHRSGAAIMGRQAMHETIMRTARPARE